MSLLKPHDIYKIKQDCPMQRFTRPKSVSDVLITDKKFLDPDDLCTDVQFIDGLRDSNGDLLEFFDTKGIDNTWVVISILLILFIYVCWS